MEQNCAADPIQCPPDRIFTHLIRNRNREVSEFVDYRSVIVQDADEN
jgi:hypothetical protein